MIFPIPIRAESPRLDWPVYRHDVRLSSVAPGKGRIHKPEILWEYYLGAPTQPLATNTLPVPTNVADLDGDGRLEQFALDGQTIRVSDMSGKVLWTYTVDGQPLGVNVRVARLFPTQKGMQIISFYARMDTGAGQGYCFTFDQGAAAGKLAWTTGPLTGQHSPTLVIDDVDGDGQPEIVLAPHYRVQIFNGQTGKLKAEVPWDVGRNYGILLTRPRRDSPAKEIYIVCDFVLHVDCIRFQNGRWSHAWGHKYFEPNAPHPGGRQQYIRVGPNPVVDLDGDGTDEMVYMLVDAGTDDQWHLRVRDGRSGKVKADLAGVWLWSILSLTGDGKHQLVYTPTSRKRPPTFCDLHIGLLKGDKIHDLAVLRQVHPVLTQAILPATAHTIADEGQQDLLQADLDGDGRPEILYGLPSSRGPFADRLRAAALSVSGALKETWQLDRPGHRLNLVHAGPLEGNAFGVRIRDLTAGRLLTVDRASRVVQDKDLGQPGGFTTTPIAVDLDGDGRNEIVLQNAAGQIVALRPGKGGQGPPTILWSVPGVAMNPSPGYYWNGSLCPQAADLDGDGRPEVVFASEDRQGYGALTCVSSQGQIRWQRTIEGCPWGGLQAGVNLWTFGRFTGRPSGLDVYVDVHRRSKGSSEGWMLRGDTGQVVWRQESLIGQEATMPYGGGLPAVADVNSDGLDEMVHEFATLYGVLSGKTGTPVYPPAFLCGPKYLGKWFAYSSPTLADLDGDGKIEVYLNSLSNACGGFGALRIEGKPLWVQFRDNLHGPVGFAPVGDFDGDGKLEIAVPAVDGTLLCLKAATGGLKWQVRAAVWGDVVAADINGDGVQELLFHGLDNRLHAVSGRDGHEIWSVAAPGRPIVADVDGDGLLEVLAVGLDGVLRIVGQGKIKP